MLFENIMRSLLGRKKLIVSENRRVIVTENGKISAILVAGKHSVRTRDSEFESHDIDSSAVLNSKLENA